MPLNILQCTGELPIVKNDLSTDVNSGNTEKPSIRGWAHDPVGVNTKSTPSLEVSQFPGKCNMVHDFCTYFVNTERGLRAVQVEREAGLGTTWSLRMTLMPREKSVETKRNSASFESLDQISPEAGPF